MVAAATAVMLVAAGPGGALAAPRPTVTLPTCTDSWKTTTGPVGDWTNPKNWTAGVPTSRTDACIYAGVIVHAPASIAVQSLQVGILVTVDLGDGSRPGHTAIAGELYVQGAVRLHQGVTLTAARILLDMTGGLSSTGDAVVATPRLLNFGGVSVAGGTLTLTDPPEDLNGGRLTGSWNVANGGVLRLPSDVTALGGNAFVQISEPGSAITDSHGGNALAGLTSISGNVNLEIADHALVTVGGNLTVKGSVTGAAGGLTVGGTYTEAAGFTVFSGGTLTTKAVIVKTGAVLDLDGPVAGPVTNSGTVNILASHVTTGDYTQTPAGTLNVQFGDTLAAGGLATLAGTLQTGLTPHSPPPGTRATLLTYASHQGTFATHSLGYQIITGARQVVAVAHPQITAPASVQAGGQLTVSGGDFSFRSAVRIFLDTTSGTPLATTMPLADGTFQQPVTIPAGTASGQHALIAVGSDGRTARRTIQVTGT